MNRDQRLFDLAVKIDNELDGLKARIALLEAGGGGDGGTWGSITGTLSAQTDLQAALDAKQPTGSYLTANQTITLSGDVSGSGATAIAVSIGANKVTRGMLAAAVGATILGATGAGNVTDLTAAQAKTFLAITAGDVSGLGFFATGTNAANLTGTVAAAQLPAFSGGDVTSSAGSAVLSIGAGKVTLAMQANMATASVVYRKTAGSGAPEVQTLATLKTDLGLTGTNSGDQTITLSGDVSGSGTGAITATIGANKVVDTMLRQSAGLSVIGRSGNTTGNVADITGAANGVLRVSGTTLAFGAVDLATAMVTGDLPYANLAQGSARSVLGVTGNVTADVASIQGTADQVLVVNGAGTALAFGTVATGGIAGSAVTYAKIQNVSATDKLLGRQTAGAGVVEEITCTAAGRALIDDADATAQRTTLGLGTAAVKNMAVGTSAPGSPATNDLWVDTN